jgi:hypothetical protein
MSRRPMIAFTLASLLAAPAAPPALASEPAPPSGVRPQGAPHTPVGRPFAERGARPAQKPAQRPATGRVPTLGAATGPACNPPRELPAANCSPLVCPMTAEERAIAQTAWSYFERNIQPTSGLCNATDGYTSTTMWDQASALYATFAAHRLGLITTAAYNGHMSRALATLSRLPLVEGELPNKAYDTRQATMVDYANQPSRLGIGWSALDLGRLVAALQTIRACDTAHRDMADRVLLSWRWNRLIGKDRQLYGSYREGTYGPLQIVQEGRLGYQEYAYRAFETLGVPKLQDPPVKFANIYGLDIPYDARDPLKLGAHTYVVSESYIMQAVEQGLTPKLADWARRVYEVQRRRWADTGVPTAVSEDHLDRPPHFVYNTVFTDGFPWRAITDKGTDATPYKTLSTKAAFGWYTLYNEPYANLLWNTVRQDFEPKKGFYTGRYERALGLNKILTANTNGMILECLLYAKTGRPLMNRSTGVGLWERYRRTVFDLRGLPGGKGAPQVAARPRGPLAPADKAAAARAWRYFEANVDPRSGLVPTRVKGKTVDMASAGDWLAAIATAERLGVIGHQEAAQRLSKALATLSALPLAEDVAPGVLYTLDGRLAGHDEQPSARGAGWDAFDLGRLLNGLAVAVTAHPELYPEARAWVRRWDLTQVVKDGRLRKGLIEKDQLTTQVQGRVGQEQYAALGYQLWGHQAQWSLDGGLDRGYHEVAGVEVPIDRRGTGLTTSGPWLMATFEHPSPGRLAGEAPAIFAAQVARSRELGRPVALDFGAADRAPWRVNDALVGAEGLEWEAFGPDFKPVPRLRGFSTGAAFGWSALYRHPHATTLRETAGKLLAADGYARGRYDSGELNAVADARTNAMVLEALAYQAHGPLLASWPAVRRAGEARVTSASASPGATPAGTPTARPSGPPSPGASPPPAGASPPSPGASGQPLPVGSPATVPTEAVRAGWVPFAEQWSGNVAFHVPLRLADPAGPGAQTTRYNASQIPYQAYAAATVNWNPYSYFFARLTALRYLDPAQVQPWNPDFTYAFGYDDWHPGTTSLTFEHYGGNRWGGGGASIAEGAVVLGQKAPELQLWPAAFGVPSAMASLSWVPRFYDAAGVAQANQVAGRLRLGYRLFSIVDVWVTPQVYLLGTQQPWDPDFTYGFGIADWKPWSLSVTYANYAGNRFPWRAPATTGRPGDFLDGSLAVSGSWGF